MSTPEKADICVPDTQETYYEESNNEKTCSETQNTNVNESQDFRLVDFGEDESLTNKTQPSGEEICQKPAKEPDLQQTSNTAEPKTDNKSITANDDKIESERKIIEEETIESDLVKKNEINDELTDNDEDEIVQGTPPHSYTPPKKADGDIEGASLKRKAGSFEEPPAKVLRTTSMENAVDVKEKFVEEESRQSCKSDDSYDELFKSPRHNVIIEETQDPASQLPKSPTAPTEETMDTDTEQQEEKEKKEKAFTEKCCDVEKDENLNVSAKAADDTSVNDSTVATVNSLHESDMQVDEYDTKKTVTSPNPVPESIDEKPQSDTDKKEVDEKLPEIKDTDAVTDAVVADESADTTDLTNCIEKTETEIEKPTENDENIPSSQPKVVSNESPSCLKIGSKPRTSVELLYDGARKTTTDGDSESKPEVVEIDDDTEKSILESSAEIIFDQTKNGENKSKPEVVNIDDSHEERERIVLDRLDSNSEVTAMGKNSDANETLYKSCYGSTTEFSFKSVLDSKKESLMDSNDDSSKLVNGSDESKRSDKTVSIESDTFSGYDTPPVVLNRDDSNNAATFSSRKLATKILSGSKDLDNIELISISDHEQDLSNTDDGARKYDLIHNSALAKAVQVEKEIGMYVKLRCLLQIDENTKELLSKELSAVHCEPIMESALIRQKNDDTASSSLADISDNKEASPGSVNSNPQAFHLNPSRLSIMSSISSSSSASSAASLAAKLALKESVLFSLPRGPAKHAKKMSQDMPSSMNDKHTLDETYERLTREWGNNRLLITTVLNCANAELSALDTHNISNERLDDHAEDAPLQKMHSSTPEVEAEKIALTTTPKSTKKSKSLKRPRSKMTRSRAHTNGESKNSANTPTITTDSIVEDDNTPRKKSKTETDTVSDATEAAKLIISDSDIFANSSPLSVDDLIGKKVFAKWSDNNYYPGTVIDRMKTKYKVNFYDGKSKMLIPEFIIPIPKTIREGLSVYATTQTNDYGSCGIIVDVKSGKDSEEDDVRYTVETDEGERLHVQVKDIFLSADQAQVLKEEVDTENNKSLPSTPKHLGQVSLDNMVEGKRRSKRIGTPVFSTPKAKNASSSSKIKPVSSASGKTKKKQSGLSESENMSSDTNAEPVAQDEYAQQKEIITRSNYSTPKTRNASNSSFSKTKSEPSVSGMAAKTMKKRNAVSENESTSSDTNADLVMQDEYTLWGLQREIIDTPIKSNMKGPKHRVKSKFSKKAEVEDEEMKKIYGPIPSDNTIFKGLSFILTCAPTDYLDRYHDGKTSASGTETETDNEAEWLKRPFVRERLQKQIVTGGGKVYEDFNEIPKEEYANTKHITNVPNTTAKSILCLSVGIPSYNHKWIIRCCLEEKLVNSAEEMLPTGWSLQRRTYVEAFQIKIKPLSQHVIIIPNQVTDQQFATFWSQVCDNAGAVVLVAESSENIEEMEFDSAAVIVSNQRCPSWAVEKAQQLRIPIMSVTWVIQCLIEGRVCPYSQHACYKYNYIKN
ncbi:microtubule-associated protein futsch-like [Odontomachus brunneus]|uniref:microtubule-associated protein futsch-like n=1 Tax=Odontomachus brunneus TaxID=486640 RepID=UPI0013F20009|nr:microtubule-associated protein futsch-like [Odontomachus brunneus]